MKKVIVLAALSTVPMPSWAITLDEALQGVVSESPEILSAAQEVEQSKQARLSAMGAFLPTVSAEYSASNSDRDVKNGNDTQSRPRAASLTVRQTLFSGGQNVYNYREFDALEKAARAAFVATSQSVVMAAVDAYVSVLTAQDVLELQNNQVQVLEKQLSMAKAQFEQGEVTKTDVQQAQARLSSAIAGKVAAHATFITAKEAYTTAFGEIAKDLEWPTVNFDVDVDVVSLRDEVLAAHPSVQAALARVNGASNALKEAYGAHAPTVSAYVSQSRLDDRYSSDYEDTTAGVTVSIPLFEGGRTQAAVRSARAVKDQQEFDYETTRRNVSSELVAAAQAYESSVAVLRAYEAAEKAAQSARDGVVQEQSVGERTTLDVLDAEQELLEAMVNVAKARGGVITSAYRTLASQGALVDHFTLVDE